MDRALFFDVAKKAVFNGSMNTGQVDGCEIIIDTCLKHAAPLNDAAYILATACWETARTMLPVMETRQPSEKSNPSVDTAIRRLNTAFKNGRLKWVKTPYWRKDKDGKSWLGRGYPQLTHKANYEKASALVGVDLVANPERMLEPQIAAEVMVLGMIKGTFTGKGLRDFIDTVDDSDAVDHAEYVKARAIINGKDKAKELADLAIGFERALRAADYDIPVAEKHYTDTVHVALVQAQLDGLGYNTGSKRKGGTFDGVLGDLTAQAILASKRENGFEPVDDRITNAYLTALAGFKNRNLPREKLTPAEVRERSPEVQTNWFQKIAGSVIGIAGLVGGTYKAVNEALGDARGVLEPILGSVPWWGWAGAAVGLGGYFFYQGRRGEQAGITAFKQGGR